MQKMAICLTLRVSDRLGVWLLASHLTPVVLVAPLLPGLPAFLFLGLTLAMLYFSWRRYMTHGIRALRQLPSSSSGRLWQLQFTCGKRCRAVLFRAQSAGYFWQYLEFLDARDRRYRVLLTPDSCSADVLRQLRVWLKLNPP